MDILKIINETIEEFNFNKNNIWYHASPNKFNVFDKTNDIGYHFGTKEQAIDRMKQLKIKNFYLYEVKLNVNNLLNTIDKKTWFGFNLLDILSVNKLVNRNEMIKKLEFLKKQYKYDNNKIVPNWSDKALNEWNNELKNILYSSKYDGIIYKNKYENKINQDYSVIVFDKKLITILNIIEYNGNLNEATAARDKEFYDIADEFYEKMIVELNNGNYIEQDEKLIIFKAIEINPQYYDLLIYFVRTNSNYTNTPFGNTSTKGNYAFGTLRGNKVIVIPNLRNDMNPSNGILKDSFIHEFIHYLDYVRSKGNFPNFNEKTTMSDYYNSPSEYNAYYQEAANYLVNLLKDEKVLSILQKNHPTFNSFYNWMVNNVFRKQFIAHLNDKNKRKLEKRIYNIYSEYIQNNNS